jgi:hypothetical protein
MKDQFAENLWLSRSPLLSMRAFSLAMFLFGREVDLFDIGILIA